MIVGKKKRKTKGVSSVFYNVVNDIRKNPSLYLMILPVIIFYLLFCYKPMYGILMAFQEYKPIKGVWGSNWVGLKHFKTFFNDVYFERILRNTLRISISSLLFSFPAPIILALLLNEVKNLHFKKTVQTITYLPHFISLVVVCGLVKIFTKDTGLINQLLGMVGLECGTMLAQPQYFTAIYVISGIWQHVGWDSIIYLSALSAVDQELYEAAKIDGAGRWRLVFNITLPSILPTIVIMLILRIGSLLSIGSEKVLLLYNQGIYETADIISTYVYRKGLQEYNWSYSTAVGLFNTLVNFILLTLANKASKKLTESSLW